MQFDMISNAFQLGLSPGQMLINELDQVNDQQEKTPTEENGTPPQSRITFQMNAGCIGPGYLARDWSQKANGVAEKDPCF